VIIFHLGIGTQIDGFAHVAIDGRHYNGVKTADVIRPDGAIRYGIGEVPPIVGRGALLDMTAIADQAELADDAVFNRKEIEAAPRFKGALQSVVHPIAIR
jgi:hypothetical protein